MEEQPLYDQIDFNYDWYSATVSPTKGTKNHQVTAKDLTAFICPSVEGRPNTYTTDYTVLVDVSDHPADGYCPIYETPGLVRQKRNLERLAGILQDSPTSVKKVSDGLSKTFMFFESAGRPNVYDKSKAKTGDMPLADKAGQGLVGGEYQWADPAVYGVFGNNKACGLSTIMNCDNYTGIYSFHPGGAMVLYGDGSTELINEDIDLESFISLFTRAADDIATSK